MKLLYRATRDGLQVKNVIDKINNKSELIFLYLTGNKRIFGNYIKIKLQDLNNQLEKYYNDENAFVFSLNNNKIYKILKSDLALRFCSSTSYCILTGNTAAGNGFYYIDSKFILDDGLLKEPKVYNFEKNRELTEGENKFNELEIFQIS